jgi:hypothetical protein
LKQWDQRDPEVDLRFFRIDGDLSIHVKCSTRYTQIEEDYIVVSINHKGPALEYMVASIL